MRKHKLGRSRSSVILTAVGAVGTVVTAALAVRATPKAARLLEEKKREEGLEKLDAKDTVKACWKCYIPAAVSCGATIMCIAGANILSAAESRSLVGAYALLENSYRQYKGKVRELYGEEAHNRIADSIAKEKCGERHISVPGIVSSSTLDIEDENNPEAIHLFYDTYSGKYFETTVSRVLQAEYHLNRNFALGGDVGLIDFYDFLGLDGSDISDRLGWRIENDNDIYWIDFSHHKVTLDDGMEVFVIDMVFEPELRPED